MRLEGIALYRTGNMHGLRCDPALLGWTRVLDEWVVGLMSAEPHTPSEWIDWSRPDSGIDTLARAVTRVRSFAFREESIDPTTPLEDGMLRFELQGRPYRVAFEQRWPEAADDLGARAAEGLTRVTERAVAAAGEAELPVGVLLLTPRFTRGPDLASKSRELRCSGCAFSFPHKDAERYRHGSGDQPGALLLIQAGAASPALWA